MKIRISGKARADLVEIYRYLMERNPAAAENSLNDIDARLCQLSLFPFMGRERSELAENLRSALAGTHLIFYSIGDDEIVVIRIIDGRMDIDKEFRP
ncbi:MAG: type II toxin-antitoxin system RelE/ParE family toxin [Rhodopseudomonas sp.]|nr:type II toxin-antitoxin system RelE/ParE family toxin [Rhodopseudomonas sp.]